MSGAFVASCGHFPSGRSCIELAQAVSCVALACHLVSCSPALMGRGQAEVITSSSRIAQVKGTGQECTVPHTMYSSEVHIVFSVATVHLCHHIVRKTVLVCAALLHASLLVGSFVSSHRCYVKSVRTSP